MGYVFKGWNTKKDGTGTTITQNSTVEKNLTVYANWKGEFTLTYNSNGGSTCNPGTVTKESGETWGTLCAPTRSGYAFKEWNTKQDGTGTKVTKNTVASDNTTVYAIWNQKYTLTYNSNGGSTCNPTTVTKESGEAWGTLCAPTKTGYTFAGWKNGTTTVTKDSKATGNITVTAEWTTNSYTLTYNSNGGSTCSPTKVTKSYNQAWGTLCTPTKSGYTFA